MKYDQYLAIIAHAAVEAGKAVMDVYESDFAVETKDDRSPLTLADKKSHEIIKSSLTPLRIPIISEEGREIEYEQRSSWTELWIVDPLDGTKEFVKRNGEFTVNIALVVDRKPVMGVVYAPVNQWLYFAAADIGAYKMTQVKPGTLAVDQSKSADGQIREMIQQSKKLPLDQSGRDGYVIVGSRSHGTPELEAFVDKKKKEKGEVAFLAAGSSLKICLVAEGAADIYPRLGPTMEWDTAAGQAIAECAGARVYIYDDDTPLNYNRQDMLNPWFVVER